jgi:hypothetical protein
MRARAYRKGGRDAAGLHGFCYYTRQDTKRAKRTGRLPLAFWAAPEGGPGDMERVGELIVRDFRDHGFIVNWNGSGNSRPIVDMRDGASTPAGRSKGATLQRARRILIGIAATQPIDSAEVVWPATADGRLGSHRHQPVLGRSARILA